MVRDGRQVKKNEINRGPSSFLVDNKRTRMKKKTTSLSREELMCGVDGWRPLSVSYKDGPSSGQLPEW